MTRTLLLFVPAAAILFCGGLASAQNRLPGAGAGSAFGGGAFGGGGATFGQPSFGQSSFGQSAFGQSSQNASPFGTGGGAGDSGFVGRTAADLEALFGTINEQFSGQRGERAGRRNSTVNSSSGRRPEVRVALRLSPALRDEVRTTANGFRPTARLQRLFERAALRGVAAEAAAGVVTLRGEVATEEQRLLAEKLVTIEPGVRAVLNELAVRDPAVELLPAPRAEVLRLNGGG